MIKPITAIIIAISPTRIEINHLNINILFFISASPRFFICIISQKFPFFKTFHKVVPPSPKDRKKGAMVKGIVLTLGGRWRCHEMTEGVGGRFGVAIMLTPENIVVLRACACSASKLLIFAMSPRKRILNPFSLWL